MPDLEVRLQGASQLPLSSSPIVLHADSTPGRCVDIGVDASLVGWVVRVIRRPSWCPYRGRGGVIVQTPAEDETRHLGKVGDSAVKTDALGPLPHLQKLRRAGGQVTVVNRARGYVLLFMMIDNRLSTSVSRERLMA